MVICIQQIDPTPSQNLCKIQANLKHTIYFVFLYLFTRYDEVDEEVIYSQESPKMEEFYRDFDWELDRFVEYRLPIKKTL